MYNSTQIGTLLGITTADIFEAYQEIGILDPTREQFLELAQHLRDVAISAAQQALKDWMDQKKGDVDCMELPSCYVRDLKMHLEHMGWGKPLPFDGNYRE